LGCSPQGDIQDLEGSKDAPRDGKLNDWRKRQQKELDQLAQDNVNLRKEMEEKMNEHCNKLDELKQISRALSKRKSWNSSEWLFDNKMTSIQNLSGGPNNDSVF
jgi:type II restriction/modification system DNA methylase subunit YeeA